MFSSDERGLALGVVGFIAILAVAALLYILFTPAVDQLVTTTTDLSDHQQATDQINLANDIWQPILFYAVFLAGLYIIARSVFESRRTQR